MSKIWKDKDRVYWCKSCDKEIRIKSVTIELVALELCPKCFTNKILKYNNDIAIDVLSDGRHD